MDTIQNACYSVRIMKAPWLALGRGGFQRQPPAPRGAHLQPPAVGVAHARRPSAGAGIRGSSQRRRGARNPQNGALPGVDPPDGALRTLALRTNAVRAGPLSPSAWSCKLVSDASSSKIFRFSCRRRRSGSLCRNLRPGPEASRAAAQPPTAGNGTYIAIDPLANVRYDNRLRRFAGHGLRPHEGRAHPAAGVQPRRPRSHRLLWFSKHWAVEGTGRGYVGTSGAAPNAPDDIKGPFVSEYFFAAGPEWLGPHNKHGALLPMSWWAERMATSRRICSDSLPRWSVSTTTRSLRRRSSAAIST